MGLLSQAAHAATMVSDDFEAGPQGPAQGMIALIDPPSTDPRIFHHFARSEASFRIAN
jgi:hypothetical protein